MMDVRISILDVVSKPPSPPSWRSFLPYGDEMGSTDVVKGKLGVPM